MEKKLPKIMAVDDDPEILDVLNDIFDKTQFRLITSSDGLEASMKARNESFDIIISDIRMPKMDGLEFVKNLRKAKKNMPIFLISASLEEYASEIDLLENVNVIAKPFKASEILRQVNEALTGPSPDESGPKDGNAIEEIRFKKGDMILDESKPSKDIFLVKEGRFRLSRKNKNGQSIEIGMVGPGEILGELSSLLNATPTASAVAIANGLLVKIPTTKIDQLMKDQPKWFKILIQTYCTRLDDVTSMLAETKRVD